MVILFEIGSTPLFLLGADARQDSWLAMSVGAAAGFALLFLFLWIQRLMPELDLAGMLHFGFGRIAGTFFGAVYACYFSYQSMRNLRDFGELTSLTLLQSTPMSITMLVFVLVAIYAIWKGIEIIFRLPEILLPGLLFCYFLLIVLFILMRHVNLTRLTPVAENGLWPILQAALPEILSFPFGQMLVFLLLWPLWEKPGVPVKQTVWAYIGISVFLIFMNALNIAILGPDLAGSSYLPFLQSVRTLCNLRFIERLDILVTIMIYIGLFIKMLIWYYCAVETASGITKIPRKWLIFPVGALIYGASFIERSFTQHVAIGLGPSTRIDTVFQIFIPLILGLAAAVKRQSRSAPD
ncbi:endospore germination permease [Paenibacillus sp. 7124]|uniref:Endospore germination permease n=2 Tax=Paenibacillus apii TaxID=1850370 RepID=A0A6M1PH04_9BACL|nr:endospore germination permease [Paenibacillus apii]NJJ39908.1 endospore germination permease [Paenibacillus apii]